MQAIPVIALATLLISGCATLDEMDGAPLEETRSVRDPTSWVGASKDELMTAMGEPSRAVHSQGPQGQPTYNYIYSKGNNSQDCIATYLIEKSSGTVLEYHCY